MKICIAILTVAIATLDATLVEAAECTDKELMTISDTYSAAMEEGTAACPDMTTATDPTTVDYCSDSDCLDFMSSMLDELPDCSSGGVELKAGLQIALDYCESGTADTSGILTDASSSSAPATDASSSSVFRSESSGSTTDTSSDKITAATLPPASGGSSSSASTMGKAITTAAFAVTAFAVMISL